MLVWFLKMKAHFGNESTLLCLIDFQKSTHTIASSATYRARCTQNDLSCCRRWRPAGCCCGSGRRGQRFFDQNDDNQSGFWDDQHFSQPGQLLATDNRFPPGFQYLDSTNCWCFYWTYLQGTGNVFIAMFQYRLIGVHTRRFNAHLQHAPPRII